MLIKNTSMCIIVALLLLSITVMFPPSSVAGADTTYVSVINPITGNNTFALVPDTPVNTTVVANITVTDITDLIGWQVNLTWDPNLLYINSSDDVYLPSDHVFEDLDPIWVPPSMTGEARAPSINNTMGYLCAVCARGPESIGTTFSGSGTMFQVKFKTAKNGTGEPVCCEIALSQEGEIPTWLRKGPQQPIEFTPQDSYYCIPEFPTILFPMLFLIATLLAFTFGSKAWSRKR